MSERRIGPADVARRLCALSGRHRRHGLVGRPLERDDGFVRAMKPSDSEAIGATPARRAYLTSTSTGSGSVGAVRAMVVAAQRSVGNAAVARLLTQDGSQQMPPARLRRAGGVVVQRHCGERGDAVALADVLRPAVTWAVEESVLSEANLADELPVGLTRISAGHLEEAQRGRALAAAVQIAALTEPVPSGGVVRELGVGELLHELSEIHRQATRLPGISVSAGFREVTRVIGQRAATAIARAAVNEQSGRVETRAVQHALYVAATALQDADALLRLELEGTVTELLQVREEFDRITGDRSERAALGEQIGYLSRQALLLNAALQQATAADDDTTPLDAAIDARAAEIQRLRDRASEASSTLSELGNRPELLAAQAVTVGGVSVERLNMERDETAVLPEQAFPQQVDDAERAFADDLAEHLNAQASEVRRLHDVVVPPSPAYTLEEFIGVYRRWKAFHSTAQEQRDPIVELALGLMGQTPGQQKGVYQLLGMDVGDPSIAAQGGIGRVVLMQLAVNMLQNSLGGQTAQFSARLDALQQDRVEKVGGTATEPSYGYAEQYLDRQGRSKPPSRPGSDEARSRESAQSEQQSTTAATFSAVAEAPPQEQPALATTLGLTNGPVVPLVGMRSVDAREGWSYLVDVHEHIMRDSEERLIAREHRVVPPEVAQYLLAARQQQATLAEQHRPTATDAGGRPIRDIGSISMLMGGVEGAAGTAAATYLQGEEAPEPPREMERLQGALRSAQESATPGDTPRTVGSLISEFADYLGTFFLERQDMAHRVAAVFHIADIDHGIGGRLATLLDPNTMAAMITDAVQISAIMMSLNRLGTFGQLAARAYGVYLSSQGVSNVAAVISIAGFCQQAAGADSLQAGRAWGYVARNIADDAAELFENMVTSPVTHGLHALVDSPPSSPRELGDALAPLMRDPAARDTLLAGVDARIAELESRQEAEQITNPDLLQARALRDSLLGRTTAETAHAAETELAGGRAATEAERSVLSRPPRTESELAALRAGLGDLAAHVPIVPVSGQELPGSGVRVRYDDDGGVRLEIGPDVTPTHVRQHAQTARMLRRYQGVLGRVRRLLSRVRQLITGDPAYGTEGFEARAEVRKLTSIISELEAGAAAVQAHADRLTGAARIDAEAERAAIEMRITDLVQQLARHQALIDSYDPATRRFVAAEDPSSQGQQPHQLHPQSRRVDVSGPGGRLLARYEQMATMRIPQIVAEVLTAQRRRAQRRGEETPNRERLRELHRQFTILMGSVPQGQRLPEGSAQRAQAEQILQEARELARADFDSVRNSIWRRLRRDPELTALAQQLKDLGDVQWEGRASAVRVRTAWDDGRAGFQALEIEHKTRLSDNPWRYNDPDNLILTDSSLNQQYLEAVRREGGIWATDEVERFVTEQGLTEQAGGFGPPGTQAHSARRAD